jgi:hypothetical protein
MDFSERLQRNLLTSVAEHRRMRATANAMKAKPPVSQRKPVSEEWKNWELAPVDSVPSGPTVTEKKQNSPTGPSAEAVQGVHKALRTIDKF